MIVIDFCCYKLNPNVFRQFILAKIAIVIVFFDVEMDHPVPESYYNPYNVGAG